MAAGSRAVRRRSPAPGGETTRGRQHAPLASDPALRDHGLGTRARRHARACCATGSRASRPRRRVGREPRARIARRSACRPSRSAAGGAIRSDSRTCSATSRAWPWPPSGQVARRRDHGAGAAGRAGDRRRGRHRRDRSPARASAVMEHGSAAAVETDRFWRERSAGSGSAALRKRLLRTMLRALHRVVLRRMDVALVAGDDAVGDVPVPRASPRTGCCAIDSESTSTASIRRRMPSAPRPAGDGASRVTARVIAQRRSPGAGEGRRRPRRARSPRCRDDLAPAASRRRRRTAPRRARAGGRHGRHRGDVRRAGSSRTTSRRSCTPPTASCTPRGAVPTRRSPCSRRWPRAAGGRHDGPTRSIGSMLADGRGIAVEPGDRDALRAGILAYLRDPPAAAAAGAAARALRRDPPLPRRGRQGGRCPGPAALARTGGRSAAAAAHAPVDREQ